MPVGKKNEHGGGARGIRYCPCALCEAKNKAWRKENRKKNADNIKAYNDEYFKNNKERIRKLQQKHNEVRKQERAARPPKSPKPFSPKNEHGGGKTGISGCECQLCVAKRTQYRKHYYETTKTKLWINHLCPGCEENYFGLPGSKHPECRSTGYRVVLPGVFYILHNEIEEVFKGGIMNVGSNRIQKFEALGYAEVFRHESKDGQFIRNIEKAFHEHCRELQLFQPFKQSRRLSGGQRGHTEVYSFVDKADNMYDINFFIYNAESLIAQYGTLNS